MKRFTRLSILLIAVMAGALSSLAQHAPGSWKILPMSGSTFESVVDTPEKVYYLTGNALYSYDKEANETTYFTPGQKLSGSGISKIYYNPAGKYLLCTYSNCNIDLIYDNGRIVNLPEIKEAGITVSKGITDISFGDGRIYVATTFGMVIYDDKDHRVIESGIYNEEVRYVLEVGDYILVNRVKDGYLYFAPKSGRHNSLDKFTPIQSVAVNEWYSLDTKSYITRLGDTIWKVALDFNAPYASFSRIADIEGAKGLYRSKDGFVVCGTSQLVQIDNTGKVAATTPVPDGYGSQVVSMWSSPNSVWAGNSDGIGCVDFTTGTIKSQKYFPESSKQFNTAYAVNTNDGSKVVFNGIGRSEWHPKGNGGGNASISVPLYLESYDWNTGSLESLHPIVKEQYSSNTQGRHDQIQLDLLFGGPGKTVFDPVDPDLIYHANNYDGLFIIKDRKILYNFNKNNSPIHTGTGCQAYELVFDNNGNLWVGEWRGGSTSATSTSGIFKIIPKESLELLRKDPAILTEKDASGQYKYWLQPAWPSTDLGKCDIKMLFSSHSNKGIRIGGQYGGPIIGYDTKGTTSVKDDIAVNYTAFVDQDGAVIANPTYKTSIVEDKTGNIWIGTTVGPLVVKDLDQIADNTSTYLNIVRPKVARNDGTNYADYLLSTDQIYAIAVDCNNHKWIGTSTSGLFHVNEDGTEIIEEFNNENSPLVSNTIYMLACNPNGNDILIGTPEGLFVYSSDSAPAADDYSEVYAFPNPVRPDYNGWITISGLMDNSLIKIADAQGHVIWSGRSEGGMAMWDGCDAAGNRVRSGVYMVYASQNADGDSSGAVTKIVVVN